MPLHCSKSEWIDLSLSRSLYIYIYIYTCTYSITRGILWQETKTIFSPTFSQIYVIYVPVASCALISRQLRYFTAALVKLHEYLFPLGCTKLLTVKMHHCKTKWENVMKSILGLKIFIVSFFTFVGPIHS